jgi:hypothetical protein
MQSKTQLIEGIQQINQSARPDWLNLFDTTALKRYLDHLHWQLEPRGGAKAWIREGETPAIMTRQPLD